MSRVWIKICGVRDPETAAAAAEAGADAVGMVFVPDTPRCVDDASAARRIAEAVPDGVEVVGLFVDASAAHIRSIVDEVGLTMVQLHGSETPAQARQLAPTRVMKALPFDAEGLPGAMTLWAEGSENLEAVIVDAPAPRAAGRQTGGHGQPFDWDAMSEALRDRVHARRPHVVLAGGLTPENVVEAIATVRPWGVDVSSGVEAEHGVKDVEKIRAFCRAVRGAGEA